MVGAVGYTFLWTALLFAGAAGLVICLWYGHQEKRHSWRRTICIILCAGAVLTGTWYFRPFDKTTHTSDREVVRVVAEYQARPAKSVTLEGENAEAFLRLIDPIHVRRYRLWDQRPYDTREYIYVLVQYATATDGANDRLELYLGLEDTVRSSIRFNTFQWYDVSVIHYAICDPAPIVAYLKPLLGL